MRYLPYIISNASGDSECERLNIWFVMKIYVHAYCHLDWLSNRLAALHWFPPTNEWEYVTKCNLTRALQQKTNYLQKRCVYIQIFLLLGSAAATGCWCCRCGFAHVRQNVIVKRWRCRWLHHFVANWARRRRSAGIAERCTGRRHRHLWQSRCRRIANKSSRLRWILKSTTATTATQIVAIRKIDQRAGTFFLDINMTNSTSYSTNSDHLPGASDSFMICASGS